MARTVQLYTAGIIALAGSVFALAAGLKADSSDRTVSILFAASGFWGIATAVGVLCRWRWARISMRSFGGLIAYVGALFAPVFAFIRTPHHPGSAPLSEPRLLLFCAGVALALFGMWWVVLFSKGWSGEYFKTRTTTESMPFSLVVIGWYLVSSGTITGFQFVLQIRHHSPTMHFGFLFTGWTASVVTAVFSAVQLYLGIGMLRGRRKHVRLTIYYGLFLLLDIAVFLFRPDRDARVAAFVDARATSFPASTSYFSASSLSRLMQISSIEWGVLTIFALWLLASHKNEFMVAQESLDAQKSIDPRG